MFNLQLTCVDIDELHDTYTYYSDNGMRMSWIDPILCSRPIVPFVSNVNVRSDHRPIYACFNSFVPSIIDEN